jgi:hypothetical protein
MNCRLWFSLVFVALSPLGANAVNPANWSTGLITTTGDDVSWMSPTTVTTGLANYDWTYQIVSVEARSFGIWFNITSQLEDEGIPLAGGDSEGGLPFILVDESLDESGTSADFLIQVDATGRGMASITNVTFGTFGGFPVTGIRASANFSVTGYPYGDYDRDRDVDQDDYAVWQSTFDSTTELDADGNRSGIVDAADYVLWRDHSGQATGAGSSTAIPEPSTFAMLLVVVGSLLFLRQRAAK